MFQPHVSDSRTYGVKFQARCLAPVVADKSRSRFLIGTLSLREENEIHLIELSEDGYSVTCEGLFRHQHEIWDLATCPFDDSLISTVYSSAGESHAAIWQLPQPSLASRASASSSSTLRLAVQLSGPSASGVQRVVWPAGEHAGAAGGGGGGARVATVHEDTLRLWDLTVGAQISAKQSMRAASGSLQQLYCGAWDPHHADVIATSADSSFSTWDLRTGKKATTVDAAHFLQIRDLEFNRVQEHILGSCGDDSRIRLWDMRSTKHPVIDHVAHSHWAWKLAFNPFYSQMLISSGTDLTANLWLVPTMGKGQVRSPAASRRSDGAKKQADLLTCYNDYEDSVYGLAWSAVDPWQFASLSYDGRLVVHAVPPAARNLFLGVVR